MNRRQFCAAVGATLLGSSRLIAEPTDDAQVVTDADGFDFMTMLSKTGGGKQFWADVWFFREWRIQCNALTNHYRLLDGANHRLASGTFEVCRGEFDKIRERDKLAPMEGRA